MAMIALETNRMANVNKYPRVRQSDIFSHTPDDMDAFMLTFDHEVTVSSEEPWSVWARRNKVDQRHVSHEHYLLTSFLGLSPYMKHPDNRGDLLAGVYDVRCELHGSEDEYLRIIFLLTGSTSQ